MELTVTCKRGPTPWFSGSAQGPKAGKCLGEEDDPPMNHKTLTSLHIVRPDVVPEHEEKTEGPFSKNPFALSSLEFT